MPASGRAGAYLEYVAKPPAMSPSDTPIDAVLDGLPERKREEAALLLALMADLTGEVPRLWATRIVGFGQCRYRYDTGREGIMPLAAFATTRRQHTVYLVSDFVERYPDLVSTLGRFTHGKSCLYLSTLDDVDLDVLRALIDRSLRATRATSAGSAPTDHPAHPAHPV